MAVDAIGATLGAQANQVSNSSLNQNDLIKLFLTQLQYQDPMSPMNNEQFLAQLAQFANLQESQTINDNIQNLVFMNSSSQSVGLLSKQVEMATQSGQKVDGTVTAIQFTTSGPLLTITAADGSVQTGVHLSQIDLVRP